ncbi:hypothetical protein [Photobacterium toruni]|uniref:Uncharacterized protein n=1 Tax=Photobacterium toruni TaxID=1935446 RepID=A0A1T4UJB8_9GAMM|nr:hypothetical protein [Photobacterium toruni]SKA52774.1 hypothetical protein CZ814_03344 [Photobacterium toruni]
MPEEMNAVMIGTTALAGIGMKVIIVCLALALLTAMRKVFNGKQGVCNEWIEKAVAKGDYRSVAIYQCVMFASTCYLLGSVLS